MNTLPALLASALTDLAPAPLRVGFSAGLDSTVLLHALAHTPAALDRNLSALHICHGLHPDAPAWADHAARFAKQIGVPFQHIDVDVSTITEEGVEAAARRARYAAFSDHLPSPGILALAHHRDDQVETLLLRLLHGAGHEGLAAMRPLRALRRNDPRQVWRPLLDVPRSTLETYARAHALDYIEDPANAHPDYIRNRVRHSVLPILRANFPQAEERIAAAAKRMREEADALDTVALALLQRHADPDNQRLTCAPFRSMPLALVRRVVGTWLDSLGLSRPPAGIWARLLPELVDARVDASPELAWRGARLRRYREHLYADAGSPDPAPHWSLDWDGTAHLKLPEMLGTLRFEPALQTPLELTVRPRHGGEVLQLRGQRRSVKKLLQEAAIAPWQRARLPLLFNPEGELLSIAGRWNSDSFSLWMEQQHIRLHLYYDDVHTPR